MGVMVFLLVVYIKGLGLKWDLLIVFLVLGIVGWGIGVILVIIDGMVVVNKIFYNIMWVSGYFYIYLLLGEVVMVFGFVVWLVKDKI